MSFLVVTLSNCPSITQRQSALPNTFAPSFMPCLDNMIFRISTQSWSASRKQQHRWPITADHCVKGSELLFFTLVDVQSSRGAIHRAPAALDDDATLSCYYHAPNSLRNSMQLWH